MNLRERKAMLKKKQSFLALNAKLTAKKAEGAKLKLKAADTSVTLSEDELANLQALSQECVDACASLKDEIDALGEDAQGTQDEADAEAAAIEQEEKSLEDIAAKGKLQKSKSLGGQHVSYLKTKQSGLAFFEMLKSHNGQSFKSFQDDWFDHVASKGVAVEKATTGIDDVLPTSYVVAIANAFTDYQGVIKHVTQDPRYVATFGFNSTKNYGKGQKRGVQKKDAEFAFTKITLDADTVYAKVSYSYADQKKDTSGAYLDYLMSELAQMVLRAVERAIVIGDGLDAGAEDKITGIASIAEETEATLVSSAEADFAAATYTQATVETIVAGLDLLEAPGQPILVTSKAVARKLRMAKDAEGRFLDPNWAQPINQGEEISILGYATYVYDWMVGATNPLVAFADKAFTLNGDTPNADRFEWYDIKFNQNNVEYAGVIGGRLTKYKGGVKFTQKAAVGG